jgi:hypothetical protein
MRWRFSRARRTRRALLKAATTAMGAENLKTVEFYGNGWDACLGQAWSVNDGRWARWELQDYNRAIDFDTVSSRHTAQQRAGMDAQALGGCGAAPGAMARPQQSNISGTSAWPQQLQIWLTPYGFIKLAGENKATAETQNAGGKSINVVAFSLTRGNATTVCADISIPKTSWRKSRRGSTIPFSETCSSRRSSAGIATLTGFAFQGASSRGRAALEYLN